MEKKTIGSFIAALRKANGMTQKNLAEMLNVSDKTVSRWERDESAPELSLIPVIAEIFGVTSDELLRGEKKLQGNIEEKSDTKREKQLQWIAESNKTKFTVKSVISVGISVIGIIAAMIANFGFTSGTVGFFINCVFIAASVICETAFTILAFSSVKTQDYEEETANICKKHFFKTACFTFYIISVLFASTLPIIMWTEGKGYFGVALEDWLIPGLAIAAGTALICFILNIFITNSAIKKEIFKISSNEAEKTRHITSLTLRSLAVLIAVVFVTYTAQFVIHEVLTPLFFTDGNVFENYDEFKEFMETDMPDTSYVHMTVYATQTIAVPNYEDVPFDDEITYYDDDGNEISEEEALTEYVYDDDGHILCKYINRNKSVYSIKHNNTSDDKLPITVYTYEQFYEGRKVVETFDTLFIAAYAIELALTSAIYITKRKKIK